ncbi:MAG: Na/Pi cotransporter family protein [Oscillospiraceae bacterium]|nr:Na/Pi cotransporter family protein [Oscillospiraceae bacterium]
MSIFDALELIGGLCLFLFGMDLMGTALERRAGGKLRTLLGKLTTNRFSGLLTGLGVTSVIQSSSAATVMVVGFVNSGLMTLRQSIGVIMGANIGTTVTAWILSLGGIDGSNMFIQLLKPTSFTPILALIGMVFLMFFQSTKKRDTGTILLGFATLMFGMDIMSGAVSGLADIPAFQNLFLLFENPLLGVLAGAVLTAIIQSSSASVGILQALSATGSVSMAAAIPIIMGQNIGTTVTALISCIGTNKNARRAALVHFFFNVIGTIVWLTIFLLLQWLVKPAFLNASATHVSIATAHSFFNITCTIFMYPLAGFLERLVMRILPETEAADPISELDDRLLTTPAFAIERCRTLALAMADTSITAFKHALSALHGENDLAESIRAAEEKTDHYEDILGSYLVKISGLSISEAESAEISVLLKMIGDFERISDHAVNLLESVEELHEKKISFTPSAQADLTVLSDAANEILDLAQDAFHSGDFAVASMVEPLEQVIDGLKVQLRDRHIARLQRGECTIETGFIWSNLLTDFERASDHCSNIAGCIIDLSQNDLKLHASLRDARTNDPNFFRHYENYKQKYKLA